MEVIIERACGMDIHKDSITACIMTSEGKVIQSFSTKTVFLLQLIDWIKEHGCTLVAMESTGVFWKPIVNILEAESIEFLVVNSQHIKARSLSSATIFLNIKVAFVLAWTFLVPEILFSWECN